MNYYFITGASSGIGLAFAELLLRDKDNFVTGLSRSKNITHKNYLHAGIDLKDLNAVKRFEFPVLKDAGSIILVNNAAAASQTKHLGKRDQDLIIDDYSVNIISPALLMNNFLQRYQNENCKRIVLNISSGAGKRAIEAWSTYCSSKAALEMISEVSNLEQRLKYPDNPVYIFAVGPGVVDTNMQAELRKISPEDFSLVGQFIEFKEKGQLSDPKDTAEKLRIITEHPERFEKVSFSVKDF
ncbi:MAG: SDR family NAD(P)-dependent oxidoreductase [Bacteroidetes bacterium]|nr:SDR family NAD(P)-dependent oxidoreductase [Bacteroidota bacterium]